jgi:hypothetical protein
LFAAVILGVLGYGWVNREDSGLTPEKGIGYWLGIVGGSLMLLLLLYPLRKRMRNLRALGTVAFWFRAHMILGIFGPILVLLHANFRLGSINSNVALVAMVVVAISGVVGRYLYGRIHRGLYGQKAELEHILSDADAIKASIGADLPVASRMVDQLNKLAKLGVASTPTSVLGGLFLLPLITWRAGVVRSGLLADLRRYIAFEGKRLGLSRKVRRRRVAEMTSFVELHVGAVKKAAALAFYERLFRLWHLFHLPLFLLMVLTVIVHIFAAHFF